MGYFFFTPVDYIFGVSPTLHKIKWKIIIDLFHFFKLINGSDYGRALKLYFIISGWGIEFTWPYMCTGQQCKKCGFFLWYIQPHALSKRLQLQNKLVLCYVGSIEATSLTIQEIFDVMKWCSLFSIIAMVPLKFCSILYNFFIHAMAQSKLYSMPKLDRTRMTSAKDTGKITPENYPWKNVSGVNLIYPTEWGKNNFYFLPQRWGKKKTTPKNYPRG